MQTIAAPDGTTIQAYFSGRDDAFFNDLPGFFRSITWTGDRFFKDDANGNFRFVYSGKDAQAGWNVNAIIREFPLSFATRTLGWGFGPSITALDLQTSVDHDNSPVSIHRTYALAPEAFPRVKKTLFVCGIDNKKYHVDMLNDQALWDQVPRLELAIVHDESGVSGAGGVVFRLYQRAVLTGSRDALAVAEARQHHERALVGYLRSVEQGEQHYLHHLADFSLDVCHDVQAALRYAQLDRPADALRHQANNRCTEAEQFATESQRLNPHLDEFHVNR